MTDQDARLFSFRMEAASSRKIHRFDNGLRVFDDHLIPLQRERYAKRNVHEAEEEDIFVELIRALPSGACFVNIGAAIGYYVILAKKLTPGLDVHAIEPLERHRRFLLENLALNGLSPADLTIHTEGICAAAGNERFLDRGFGSRIPRDEKEKRRSLSTRWKELLVRLGLRKAKGGPAKIVEITTITLDALVARIGRPIDLLQMDVQGLEVDVLQGGSSAMAKAAVRTFLIGTHSLPIHQECAALLRAHDYTIDLDRPDAHDQPDGIIVASKTRTA
jgi:FkbM family methyltransferase